MGPLKGKEKCCPWLEKFLISPFLLRYVFLEYSNPNEALDVLKGTNGYKFDKNHTFSVNLFTDFDKFDTILDKWETPVPQPFKEQGCLQYYLLESDACDQFSVVYEQGDKVGIFLNTQPEPSVLEERPVSSLLRWMHCYYSITFHSIVAEMDRDIGPLVSFGYLPGYFPC